MRSAALPSTRESDIRTTIGPSLLNNTEGGNEAGFNTVELDGRIRFPLRHTVHGRALLISLSANKPGVLRSVVLRSSLFGRNAALAEQRLPKAIRVEGSVVTRTITSALGMVFFPNGLANRMSGVSREELAGLSQLKG